MANGQDKYVLGYSQAEQERLQQQARDLAPESAWIFDQIGLAAGARVVEIGCGPQGCLDMLSDRVGPSGQVVGIERNQDAVNMARALIKQRGLGNVEVFCRDARSTELPRASFDLAWARLVLVNIPEPRQVLAEAFALVRPGGWIAFHEVDWAGLICDPACAAYTKFIELFVAYSEGNGIDQFIGRKLPRLLRETGAVDVRVDAICHVYPPGHPRRSILWDFAENLNDRLVAQNLISQDEFTELKAELRRHIDDPDTLILWGPYVRAFGRKPK